MDSPGPASSTTEALFLGSFVEISLLTLTIAQAWSYFRRNKDGWILQTFVASLVLLDMAESTAVVLAIRNYLITHFGNHTNLRHVNRFLYVASLLTFVIFFLSHLFFAKRVFTVCRRKWLFIPNVALTVIMFGFGLVSGVRPVLQGTNGTEAESRAGLVAHILACILDLVVTVALTISLSEFRLSAKAFVAGSTRELLHRVLVYTMSRGIVMTFAQCMHMAMFLSKPNDPVFWAATHFIVSKLYVLTTLVTLNLRRHSQEENEVVVEEILSLRFANRDSVEEDGEDEEDEELEKARAIQSAPAFLQRDGRITPISSRIRLESEV